MSDITRIGHTFDGEEAAQILREAAQLGDPSARVPSRSAPEVQSDGLTLTDIARAAAEVGIKPSAVVAASVNVAVRKAHVGADYFHLRHELVGELTADEYDRLVSEIRTVQPEAGLERTSNGLDVTHGSAKNAPGSLLLQLRSRNGMTTMEIWSRAPRLGKGGLLSLVFFGVLTFAFPTVAMSGGQPELAKAAGLAALGALMGAGVGKGVQRLLLGQWRMQLVLLVLPVSSRVAELVEKNPDESGQSR